VSGKLTLFLYRSRLIFPATRTGVRVAEGAGLENRYTRKGIVGSNPTLSVSPELIFNSPACLNRAAALFQGGEGRYP
jgi:hypothetical protein